MNKPCYDMILIDAMGLFCRNNLDTNYNITAKLMTMHDGQFIETEERVAGIFGFIRTLAFMSRHFDFINLIVVWDGGNHRRRKFFSDYKKNRIAKIDAMTPAEREEHEKFSKNQRWQIERLNELLSAFGICQLKTIGEEADDLIASMCKKNEGMKIGVFSNDKDLLQLIDENVHVVKITRFQDEKKQWIHREV